MNHDMYIAHCVDCNRTFAHEVEHVLEGLARTHVEHMPRCNTVHVYEPGELDPANMLQRIVVLEDIVKRLQASVKTLPAEVSYALHFLQGGR